MMKISDKLVKINGSLNVNLYDNGYMVEVSGRDSDDDYTEVKIVCMTVSEINDLIAEAVKMDRN
jgi:hypothetical protein